MTALKKTSLYILFFLMSLVATVWFGLRAFTEDVSKAWAVEQARQTALSHKLLRKYYTDRIINVVKANSDIEIGWGPDRDKHNTVPLPLTLWFEMSEETASDQDLIDYQVYSHHAFMGRESRQLDAFAKQALEALTKGDDIHIKLDAEKAFVIAAIPDHMTSESCVNCHNQSQYSPKTNWKMGDLAGAIEVKIPIGKQIEQIKTSFVESFISMFIVITISLGVALYFIYKLLKHAQKQQENEVQQKGLLILTKTLMGLAHNINTPLGVALTAASILEENGKSREAVKLTISNIQKVADIVKLITKLTTETVLQKFNLKAAITESLNGIDYLSAGIDVTVDIPEKLDCVWSKSSLLLFLLNVMANLEHAFSNQKQRDKKVIITGHSSRNAVVIEITDNGRGMDIKNEEDLLIPFHKMGTDVSFGLAQSYCTVSAAGASMSVESKKGEYFKVSLTIPQKSDLDNSLPSQGNDQTNTATCSL